MYEQYLRDPASVGDEWRQLFDNGKVAELPVIPTSREEVLRETGKGKGETDAAEAPAIPLSPIPIPQGLTPITGPAARLAQNMTDSLSVPTAMSFREITVDVLDARRRDLNAQLAAAGKKISYTHLIGYAVARAARELPVMTPATQDAAEKPHRFDPHAVNLGLAVDVEKKDGSHALVVPVIKHAEGMDFATFHATYETLVDKARTNKLVPDDFAGATITLTNPGTIGTVASVPRRQAIPRSIPAPSGSRQKSWPGSRPTCCGSTWPGGPWPRHTPGCRRPIAALSPTRSSTSAATRSACGCARSSSRASTANPSRRNGSASCSPASRRSRRSNASCTRRTSARSGSRSKGSTRSCRCSTRRSSSPARAAPGAWCWVWRTAAG